MPTVLSAFAILAPIRINIVRLPHTGANGAALDCRLLTRLRRKAEQATRTDSANGSVAAPLRVL